MNKNAFTLLELLIVIIILGILMAILFPAMGKVREEGRRTQCINNLRQHGVAWYLYIDDHDETLPYFGRRDLEGAFPGCDFGGGIDDTRINQRPLNPYLDIYDVSSQNLELFHCPDDLKPAPRTDIPDMMLPGNNFEVRGNSYRANVDVIFYSTDFIEWSPRPLSTITTSYSKLALEMDNEYNVPGHGGSGHDDAPRIPVMVLFMDGHVGGPFLYSSEFGEGKKVLMSPDGS